MAKKKDIRSLTPDIPCPTVERNDQRCIRCHILIVCEGEATEPHYFRSFHMMQNSSSLVFEIKTQGGRMNTKQVVKKAVELKAKAEKAGKPYDAVWAVFDKDSFPDADFDAAVNMAEKKGISCAWSNEAFELWYVFHFDSRHTAMSRNEYKAVIEDRVRKAGKPKYVYQKNEKNMRAILRECRCDEERAIQRAEKQAHTFADRKYHRHNPCTMVYQLVKQLLGKDTAFNEKIKKSLEEN